MDFEREFHPVSFAISSFVRRTHPFIIHVRFLLSLSFTLSQRLPPSPPPPSLSSPSPKVRLSRTNGRRRRQINGGSLLKAPRLAAVLQAPSSPPPPPPSLPPQPVSEEGGGPTKKKELGRNYNFPPLHSQLYSVPLEFPSRCGPIPHARAHRCVAIIAEFQIRMSPLETTIDRLN